MPNNFKFINPTTLNGILWEEGTLTSPVPITQIGNLTIGGSVVKTLATNLDNTGNILFDLPGPGGVGSIPIGYLVIQQNASLNNSGSVDLSRGRIRGAGIFTNSGTFKKTTTGISFLELAFNNTGTVNVEAGFLNLSSGESDGGAFNVSSGATLELNLGPYILKNGAKINGNGTLLLDGGTIDIKVAGGTSIANTVRLDLNHSSSKLKTDGDFTLPDITKWSGGDLETTGTITNRGTLTIDGAGRKLLDGKLNNTGSIIANFARETLPNQGNFAAGRLAAINNSGSFSYRAGTTIFANGFTINNSGNFEFREGDILNFQASEGIFANSGTFRKTAGLGTSPVLGGFGNIARIEMAFNNTGTVAIESGTLLLTSGGGTSDGGTFTIASGATLGLSFPSFTFKNGAKINGTGNLNVAADVDFKLSEGSSIASTVRLSINDGTFQVDRDWTLPTVSNWVRGTLQSTGTIANTGTLTIGDANSTLAGIKYLDATLENRGSIVHSVNPSQNIRSTLLFFRDGALLENFGLYELRVGGIDNDRSGNISAFNNTGTLRKTTTGEAGIGVTFNNTGTVDIRSGTLGISGGGESNGGTFTIALGRTLQFGGFLYTLGNGTKINGTGNLIVLNGGNLDLKLAGGTSIANTIRFTLAGEDSGSFQTDGDWSFPTVSNWISGTLKSTGTIANTATLTIGDANTIFSDTQYLDATLENRGLIVHTGSSRQSSFSTLLLRDGAIFNNSGLYEFQKGNIANGPNGAIGVFNNTGTLRTTTTAGGGIGVTFNNRGTVEIRSGTLVIGGGGKSNGGTLNISTDRTLQISAPSSSGYTLENGARITGTGNLDVTGGGTLNLKLAGGTSIADTVRFKFAGGSSGIFQTDGNWTLPTVSVWESGTLKSTGTLTNSGNLTLVKGTGHQILDTRLRNTETIVQNTSRPFDFLLKNRAVLDNLGTYELQQGKIDKFDNTSVGTFNNSGTLRKTTTGGAGIWVNFQNTGTVEITDGSLGFVGNYTHDNGNLILRGGTVIFNNPLNINGGRIEGNGNINVGITNSGLLNPRYTNDSEFGRLVFNGNYLETDSATLNIQIGGNTAGTNYDQIAINGQATFKGTLNVSRLNGFTPTLGATFDVLTFNSRSPQSELDFTGLNINPSLRFLPQWSNNKLTLKVVEQPKPTLAIAPTNAAPSEGNSGNNIFTFTVTRADNTLGTNSVNWTVTGTGSNPANAVDFGGTLPSGTVTFAPNETAKEISVLVRGDTAIEPDETFTVTLSNPTERALLANPTATGTIRDDDNLSAISIANLTVVEGRNANTVLNVRLDRPSSQPVTVSYTTLPVSATPGSDYTSRTGVLSIPANSPNGAISIPILDDTLNESDEAFIVTLFNPVNATLITAASVVTITDTLRGSVTTTLPTNVENLQLTGSNPINGTGNNGNNRITGNSGNNILAGGLGNDSLNGGLGNDTLAGNAGNDTLTGAAGVDRFEFRSIRAFVASDFGVDTISDFVVNQDKIVLSKTTFAALTSGVGNGFSQASNFAVVANNSLVAASNAFIVYSRGTGHLFYNQNGSVAGLGTGANFAVLTGNPSLTASDFVLVA